METFSLLPHPQSPKLPIQLSCSIGRRKKTLSVAYKLHDPHSLVLFPEKKKQKRVYGLWEKTCFELFITEPGTPKYWEINLSPARLWNAFSFTAERVGMEREDRVEHLPFLTNREKRTGFYTLATKLHLDNLHLAESILHLGISAVIQTNQSEYSYWALFHPNPQPDFHDRASFILQL